MLFELPYFYVVVRMGLGSEVLTDINWQRGPSDLATSFSWPRILLISSWLREGYCLLPSLPPCLIMCGVKLVTEAVCAGMAVVPSLDICQLLNVGHKNVII